MKNKKTRLFVKALLLNQERSRRSELAKTLTPDIPFFCKRVLFIDDYYTTFNKPHVHLVDEPGGVVALMKNGLEIASGDLFEFDVIIYATGFDSNFILS